MTRLNLRVRDMACSACADRITKAVQIVDPAATVSADTDTKAINITTSVAAEAVTSAIAQAGYTVAE